jgi:8-oxo-dGTP diphosphatase
MNTALQMLTAPAKPQKSDEIKKLQIPTPPVQRYSNPIPVTVGLVPVIDDQNGRIGLLTIRRGIEPAKGKLALPGGYLEHEDWKDGCARELTEETGIEFSAAMISDKVTLASVQNGSRLLLFAETRPIHAFQLTSFIPNRETLELVAIYEPTELAFPTHTQQAKDVFERLKDSAPFKLTRGLPL